MEALPMISIEIDGNVVDVDEGSTVLEAARGLGIDIPTLCHHAGLTPYGACRLCVVEVEQRGRKRIESSCTRPVEPGMVVHTDTEDLREYRRTTAELLVAQCPDSKPIRELAERLGVETVRFSGRGMDCILCGLCTRACQQKIGTPAISFIHRGVDRQVATPFEIQSDVCIGCGACASVCPTGCITIEDVGNKRLLRVFNTELELQACSECGAYFAPERMIDRLKAETEVTEGLLTRCPACRRKAIGAVLRQAMR